VTYSCFSEIKYTLKRRRFQDIGIEDMTIAVKAIPQQDFQKKNVSNSDSIGWLSK
jgi:hypothetical protein